MAERTGSTPLGCLGRILSLVGFAWIGLMLLVGLVGTVDEGFDPLTIVGVGALIVPAVAIIGIGRAIRRRAGRRVEQGAPEQPTPVPDRPRETAPPPPPRRRTAPLFQPVSTEEEEVAEELLEELGRLRAGGDRSQTPKTSQEMIEEAKKRWRSRR